MTIQPFTHDSPEWHALRAANVGGSEVAALFDCQPAYAMSRYTLWHVKRGTMPPPPVEHERAEWGIRLEQAIAEAAGERYGWQVRKGGYVTDDTTPGLGCSLDYIIEEDPDEDGPGVMEVKTVDWMLHRSQWGDDEPPVHILLQHQHQMAATGYTWGVVPALVMGNTHLELYRYRARPPLIAEIRRRVAEFWQSIQDGREPEPDGSEGADLVLRALYPELADETVDLTADNELPGLCADAMRLAADRLAAEKSERDIKNRIKAKLGQHMRAQANGFLINQIVTAANPGREPKPGELIGARKEARRLNIQEGIAA